VGRVVHGSRRRVNQVLDTSDSSGPETAWHIASCSTSLLVAARPRGLSPNHQSTASVTHAVCRIKTPQHENRDNFVV